MVRWQLSNDVFILDDMVRINLYENITLNYSSAPFKLYSLSSSSCATGPRILLSSIRLYGVHCSSSIVSWLDEYLLPWREVIKHGSGWLLGDRTNINIWLDHPGFQPLILLLPSAYLLLVHCPPTISDLIGPKSCLAYSPYNVMAGAGSTGIDQLLMRELNIYAGCKTCGLSEIKSSRPFVSWSIRTCQRR